MKKEYESLVREKEVNTMDQQFKKLEEKLVQLSPEDNQVISEEIKKLRNYCRLSLAGLHSHIEVRDLPF